MPRNQSEKLPECARDLPQAWLEYARVEARFKVLSTLLGRSLPGPERTKLAEQQAAAHRAMTKAWVTTFRPLWRAGTHDQRRAFGTLRRHLVEEMLKDATQQK